MGAYDGEGDGCGLQTGKWAVKQVDIVSDIGEIPVEGASFDAVMCIEVLEHVPNPVTALGELSRILRPGGTLVLTAPFAALTHFSPFFYSTGFSRNYYSHWLPKFGMEVVEAVPNGNYFEWLAQEVRRLPELSVQVYGHRGLSLLNRMAMARLINWLSQLSKDGLDTSELLCFGWHVLARKC